MPTEDDDMLTVEQAAERTNKSAPTIYKAISRGKLKAKRYGKMILIRPAELERWQNDPEAHQVGRRKQA